MQDRFAATLLVSLLLPACATPPPAVPMEETPFAPSLGVSLASMEQTPEGLWIEDLAEGEGAQVDRGHRVGLYYVGWLPDGTQFDGVAPPDDPLQFRVGDRDVVRGLEEGIMGMQVGGQRRIIIPTDLAYGARGAAGVPPNSILVFLVELVRLR